MLVLHYYVMNLKGWQKHEILANENIISPTHINPLQPTLLISLSF